MFFIFGMNGGHESLRFRQTLVCPCCGRYGALEAYKEFNSFSLFFIPMFSFNKRYFVRTAGCGCVSEIDKELGKKIEKGQATNIDVSQLRFHTGYGFTPYKRCAGCGYATADDFAFCPKCGRKFE